MDTWDMLHAAYKLRPSGGWVALKNLEDMTLGSSCSHMSLAGLVAHLDRNDETHEVVAIIQVPEPHLRTGHHEGT